MDLRDDERAQTVQVGAILLLGTLVIALSVYQVTSVPGQNGATEFTHNQAVHEQLQEVRTAILDTAAEGTSRSAAVALGTRYRDRIVAVNPGPPSGTLRTADLGEITIGNATAVGDPETADFWDGNDTNYSSTALTYEPNYNEYSNAPTTIYEHSVLANQFDGRDPTTLLLSNETIIDGREITLVTLDGSLSKTGSGTVSVDTRPLSVSRTTIPIRNTSGGPVTLTLSTTLPESRWQALVGDEPFVAGISYAEGTPRNRVTIRFEPGETYRLRMAKIGVGSGATTEPATYLTTVPGDDRAVAENGTRKVRVEVRDRYNNPVANETVNLTVMTTVDGTRPGELWTGDESAKSVRMTTDERGRASATYHAPRTIDGDPIPVVIGVNRTAEIDPSSALSPDSLNTVRFAFEVTNADGSPVPYEIEWNRTAIAAQPGVDCGPEGCTYDRSAGSIGAVVETTPATPDVPFSVGSSDRSVATVIADADRTGPNGTTSVRIDIAGPGATDLRASSGGSTDSLTLTTENRAPNASVEFSPETPRTGDLVGFSANASDPDGRVVAYEWTFGDGSRGFGPTPQHVYDDGGTYEVTLTVTDEYGATATTNRTITVSNRAPEAAIDYDPLAPRANETIAFSASGSSDPDGEITEYAWDVDGDGAFEATGERLTHTYPDAGTRTVSLRVTDDDGASATATVTVTVEPPSDPTTRTVLLRSDFEGGDLSTAGWRHRGPVGSNATAGVSSATSKSGTYAAYHQGGVGAIESSSLDTTGSSSVTLEYWIRKGADSFSENPDAGMGEDLVVEYLAADGTWVEIDRIEDSVEPGAAFTRERTLSTNAALHDGFRLRFRQEGASFEDGDYWHVDDVSVISTSS